MNTFRHLALIFFFIGLAALEVVHGLYRLEMLRRSQRDKLVESVAREHRDLARNLRELLTEDREHAVFLSRTPGVRSLVLDPAEQSAPPKDIRPPSELAGQMAAYLVSFRGLDRVQIFNAAGEERFRCERIGRGVGVLPEEFLERLPNAMVLEVIRSRREGEVALSTLLVDQQRVEVSESERQVLHYTTGIHDPERCLGGLVVTAYAAPVINAVRRFEPLPGVAALLVDGDGSYLACADRSRERGGSSPGRLADDFPVEAPRIMADLSIPAGDSMFLSTALSSDPPWRLVALIPRQTFDASAELLRSEYIWVIGSMVCITAVLIAAGVFFFRLSVRELRLREDARQKEMERQLQISERLGSLGLLTAGVAHEINNPLEGIGNYLSLLERENLAPEKRQRYIENVQYGFNRIRDIVRDLLTFARFQSQPDSGDGRTDLSLVMERALKMVAYAKEFKEIQVELRGMERSVLVPGDAGRLEQVFINLLINAGKAMQGRGRIIVEAHALNAAAAGDGRVEVLVDDDGPGILPGIIDKVFDPFFTTGEGAGLGLSISYGIIKAHGGTLTAENRPEGGARFKVVLPAIRA